MKQARVLAILMIVAVVGLLALASLAGCNGVTPSQGYAPTLAANAGIAGAVANPTATTQPAVSDARKYLPVVAAQFKDLYDGTVTPAKTKMTINPLAWLFDSTKPVLVSPTWYNDIRRMALDSVDAANRAASYSDANAQTVAQREAKDQIDIENTSLGK